MLIRKYQTGDEKGWVYTKALSYLFSPFFDDRETVKPPLNTDIYAHRIEWVAEIAGQVVGLLDIDIYNQECSQSYRYAPANKVAYFTNLAVHPDYQGQGIAQALYAKALGELQEHQVEKLAIFTREGDVANHLYQKWGGKLVCVDYLVIGQPKDTPKVRFGVELDEGRLSLTDRAGQALPYYLREGIYIVAAQADLDLFDIENFYQELTYIVDILPA
ncbi:GNAT family N-acetyltransferase [Streptococcus acidominimus]|uniref:GNAT family N-acetyltransferase n=1 Tax=Streptococcus acidominimus TaxID=1326 RepID=A0A4Y9FNS9_STRAI|nr:GNAT family N-acetyltransferase [Streptococcus acidominimus]MBF0818707.1 GNAT family N-acetyltransferase [Streptococcus acidominimus]MBF0838350.1 GNAT family N-acetyltransferase [Streptococcus acidominimus]MBF0847334.1 GNAT family N-acetyltransferase [Streptococcus danieliae]TFU30874.1 GNAT family N-acetyltransferase [Streptococcus acidominimus]